MEVRSKHDQELLIRLTKEVDSLRKGIESVERERTALAERATIATKEMLEERSQRILIEASMKELNAHVKVLRNSAEGFEKERAARQECEAQIEQLLNENRTTARVNEELQREQVHNRQAVDVAQRDKEQAQQRASELELQLNATVEQLGDSVAALDQSKAKCGKLQETLKLYI